MTNAATKLCESAAKALAMLDTMEALRQDGWCIMLKCLPDGFPWIAEADPSEYGGGGEDTEISRKPWCCEARDMRHKTPWRHGQFATATTPAEAVAKVAEKVRGEKR